MGMINMPHIEDYWSTRWPFKSYNFSSILKRDRFTLILRFLHLNDSNGYIPKGQAGYDPLYKIRPFMDQLLNNCKLSYNLGQEVSVDESMIGFKGRLWFIQYLPNKPTKWGMKAFVLADSHSGYTWGWKLYAGMSGNYFQSQIIIIAIHYYTRERWDPWCLWEDHHNSYCAEAGRGVRK